tara:strand:- start:649 stop:771 length:123 start_codon:yes stop_codon:yes gene_type:complete
MTYNEDLIRVLQAEVDTLRNKVEELEAKLEISNTNIEQQL